MTLDVHELSAFYASPLGETSRRLIGRVLRGRWETCSGLSLMGLGYCGPYLDRFRDEAQRTLALSPAEQGVSPWPSGGRSAAALVVGDMLPLPDACIDRALVAHALETAEDPSAVLEEVWRVLAPEGRAIIVAPSRRGVWARVDGTPFGHGQPFSRGQLRDLVRDASFSAVFWGEALYAPPFRRRVFVNWAPAIERVGAVLRTAFRRRAYRGGDQAGPSARRRAAPRAQAAAPAGAGARPDGRAPMRRLAPNLIRAF